ncbi:MAG: adenylate/guanylate cyclase domain-containing protein [Chitinophagaceae bacterium]
MTIAKANVFVAINFLLRIRGFILIASTICFFSSCVNRVNPPPVARQGRMDLSSWDFQKDGNLPLDGQWEFYWQQLLTPADFKKTTPSPTGFAMVIGEWNNDTIGKLKIPGQGFATYRLLINKASYPGLLSLRIPDISSSYRLWVNDQLVAGCGQVAANANSAVPQFLPLAAAFADHSDTLQVIVQVSNFFYARGGIWKNIYLGDVSKIAARRDVERDIQWCVAGAMFILFIYHLLIFLLRRKEYASFWFSLLCLDAALRMVLTGERVFYSMFPDFPLALGIKLEYFTVTLGLPIYVMVAHEFFKDELSKKIRNIIIVVGAIESLLVGILPASIYTDKLVTIIQVIVMLECLYLMYVVVMAMINKRNFAVISFVVYCLQFVAIVNDILYSQLIINGGFLLVYAFMTFLLVQAYILAYHYSRAYSSVEDLSIQLNAANTDLEKKVEERTHELKESNGQLFSEKKKAEDLLLNILPVEIAEELKEKGYAKARRYPSITVMFTDFMNFTHAAEELTPEQLVAEIDYCYRAYDEIIQRYGLEKIKTMGDSYICAGGLPSMNFTHPEDVVRASLDIRDFMEQYAAEKKAKGETAFAVRIGVHTGPAVAGIVGVKKFAYDIWGDSVNLAARMESSGQPGKVNISNSTYQLVKDKFACTYRGKIEAKNKGEVDMYFIERHAQTPHEHLTKSILK